MYSGRNDEQTMILFLPYALALIIVILTVIQVIVFRKSRKPGKIAKKFAILAIVFGTLHLICDFFPFEYNGPDGIDYIGQAAAFGFFVNAIIYSTLIVYLNFAIAATIYAVKAIKKDEKRRQNILFIIFSWIFALVVAGILVTNIIFDKVQKKSIKVEVKEVYSVTDYEGDPAVMVVLDFYNGTRSEVSYLSMVYGEVSQDGREIYGTVTADSYMEPDYEIEPVSPGSSIEIRKYYKLKDPSKPVKIVCSSYGGDVVYVDGEYEIS